MEFQDKAEYSLQEAHQIISQFDGWKSLSKLRAILEHNPKYKVNITGSDTSKRFEVPRSTLELLIKDIKEQYPIEESNDIKGKKFFFGQADIELIKRNIKRHNN